MTLIPPAAPERASLVQVEASLAAMMERLLGILDRPPLTQDGLVEITAIYNNVAYVFLYLEANEEHVDFSRLRPWRDAFDKDPLLDGRILAALHDLRCADAEAEESRQAYVAQLTGKLAGGDTATEAAIDRLVEQAKSVLGDIEQAQDRILDRLGVDGSGNPQAVFYRLLSTTGSTASREKLARAWTAERDRRQDDLIDLVDRMAEVRRRRTGPGRTVMDETMAKCRITEDEVEAFLGRYLARALTAHVALEAEVRAATGVDRRPLDSFPRYLRTVSGGTPPPLFDLDDCLDHAFEVARAVFGLTMRRAGDGHGDVLLVEVRRGDEQVGTINLDLWDADAKTVRANHTKGLRNRTDWAGIVQRPVAYVSCRFRRGRDGSSLLTFQNVHGLFHEFGHAVNHLLIRKRISNRSGLEYLPLERLEYLSMWFEKWVYHPDFGSRLTSSDVDPTRLAQARWLKMAEVRRTFLERAVTAALDFEMHRRADGGLADAFRRLDDRHGVAEFCTLGDFPVYFTWPMFVANPGANFEYLFGSADSCQRFRPFQQLGLTELDRGPDGAELFATCFDFDLPTEIPDSDALFDFYGAPALPPVGTVV